MEREVGGGIGMGNTCKPMAVSFQYMTKSTTNKKKKIKKIKKKYMNTETQNRNRVTDTENKLVVTDRERKGGRGKTETQD